MSLTIVNTTRQRLPGHPYAAIADKILGSSYDLTMSFVGRQRARTLNQTYRKKSYVPNVLSFPLDAKTGEIYICLEVAKKEAVNFDMTYRNYVGFLFIHGALHLKGHDHGATMEKLERQYLTAFSMTHK